MPFSGIHPTAELAILIGICVSSYGSILKFNKTWKNNALICMRANREPIKETKKDPK